MSLFFILFRKLIEGRWLTLCLFLGSVLAIALISSIPMYTEGILQKMLIKDLENSQTTSGTYPGYYSIRSNFFYNSADKGIDAYPEYHRKVTEELFPAIGLPCLAYSHRLTVNFLTALPVKRREEKPLARLMNIESIEGVEDHLDILYGNLFSREITEGYYEAIVTEQALAEHDLMLNEIYYMSDTRGLLEKPFKVKIVGVFSIKDRHDPYWHQGLWSYNNSFLIDYSLFYKQFIAAKSPLFSGAEWYYALDYHKISTTNLDHIVETLKNQIKLFKEYRIPYKIAALPVLEAYYERGRTLRTTLMFLQIPVLLLLAFYIYMASKFVIDCERNEIAALKSRGASSVHVFFLYLLESLILSGISLIIGPPLGLFLSAVIGSSNGFMEFVSRTTLSLSLSRKAYLYSIAGAAFFIITMLIPALRSARTTIVLHKQAKARTEKKAFWKRYFIDIILMAVAGYGFYSYRSQQKILFLTGLGGNDLPLDPLLFIISALSILGLGLFALRAFPYLIKFIFMSGRKRWSPILYASFIHVERSTGQKSFFMMFLILTLSIGVLSSNTARTINQNKEDRIYYLNGSDIVLREQWQSADPMEMSSAGIPGSPLADKGSSRAGMILYREPSFEPYKTLNGIEKATKVFSRQSVNVQSLQHQIKADIMGIIPHEFAGTAWFRSDLLPFHWYKYLNLLAESPMAVLCSSSFQTKHNIHKGDTIYISWSGQKRMEAVVYAFIDYWPTYNPEPGREDFIVANLQYIQAKMAIEPYEVWLKLSPEITSKEFYSSLKEKELRIERLRNTKQEIIKQMNDPMLLGTNGALTLGFIVTILICAIGFLIYSILSFRARILQFGIFRAIGLSKISLTLMIIFEQLFIVGFAIITGIVIGELVSFLFIPMLQLVGDIARRVPPFRVISLWKDYARLYAAVACSLISGFVILGILISKIKMASVIKLGEE